MFANCFVPLKSCHHPSFLAKTPRTWPASSSPSAAAPHPSDLQPLTVQPTGRRRPTLHLDSWLQNSHFPIETLEWPRVFGSGRIHKGGPVNFSRRRHIKHCGFCIAQKFYCQTFQEHPEPELTENQRFSQAGAFATLCLFYIALSCFVSIFHFHFRQLPLVFVEDDELAFCRPRHFWQLCRSGGWGGALQAQNSLSITHCGEKNLRNKPFFVVPRKCRLSFLWGLAHVAKSREKLRPLKPILTILLQILSTSCSSKTTAHSQGRGPTRTREPWQLLH